LLLLKVNSRLVKAAKFYT